MITELFSTKMKEKERSPSSLTKTTTTDPSAKLNGKEKAVTFFNVNETSEMTDAQQGCAWKYFKKIIWRLNVFIFHPRAPF